LGNPSRAVYKLVLTNRADEDHKNYFEEYGLSRFTCKTCHCNYGPITNCICGNTICEACQLWKIGKMRLLNFNKNKRTKKTQRYVLDYLKVPTSNCNVCDRIVGYRL